jgi:hypothetical protein
MTLELAILFHPPQHARGWRRGAIDFLHLQVARWGGGRASDNVGGRVATSAMTKWAWEFRRTLRTRGGGVPFGVRFRRWSEW